jgi:uncharacterized protein YndB with AHSA1/START domain
MPLAIPAVFLGLFAALFGYVVTRPDTMRVERKATMRARPEQIFPHINDLQQWSAWSPWERMDPGMKRTYTGPNMGPGAAYEWEGNKKVGAGRMEITDVTPPRQIVIQLEFIRPFESSNRTEFVLEEREGSTEVTWSMEAPNILISKLMGLFVNMDRMIGKDFEAGLGSLRKLVEGAPTRNG